MIEDTPEIAAVRPGEGLDGAALEAWLRPRLVEVLPDSNGPLTILQFPNGSANLTYLLRVGTRELVLRRPPMGQLAPGAHDMKREYRVLSRLWRRFDRAPRAYLFCDDPGVLGVDFFVMERRRGVARGSAWLDARASRSRPAHLLRAGRCHGRPARGGPGNVRPRRSRQAGRIRRTASARVGEALGAREVRRLADDDERNLPATGSILASDASRRHRPQRSQARQLPVRSREPGPRLVHLRLGHDDARRSADRPRDAAQLLARPRGLRDNRARNPAGPGAHGSAPARRDRRALRCAERERRHGGLLVGSLRSLEDGGRRAAAPPP